nr:radical SAM protein [Salinivirgaceae bacterium]
MDAYIQYLNNLVNQSKDEFKNLGNINWINPWNSQEYETLKAALIKKACAAPLFHGTKPYLNSISGGCQLCGEGKWSCLFITGLCNAKCFYCPTAQNQDDAPQSQGLTFETPESYAEYINHFKFSGVSFSGGEPLLKAEKVLQYLSSIRKNCKPNIYTWMYTNGILANDAIFDRLAAAGLNEVRFDIGATNYNLSKINHAVGRIPVVTIEIPAIPESKEAIMELLPQMSKMGVQHLNLHQLRLTPYNAKHLLKRNYTYIPAERPIVAESEIAALEIITYAKSQNIDIGINYCSFFFKHRFQKASFRKLVAQSTSNPREFITQNGYIRTLSDDAVRYEKIAIYDTERTQTNATAVPLLLKHKNYTLTRSLHENIPTNKMHSQSVNTLLLKIPEQIPSDSDLFRIWQCEYIEQGLR